MNRTVAGVLTLALMPVVVATVLTALWFHDVNHLCEQDLCDPDCARRNGCV